MRELDIKGVFYFFITQHAELLMLLIAHQIENANAAIEMNFNSIP